MNLLYWDLCHWNTSWLNSSEKWKFKLSRSFVSANFFMNSTFGISKLLTTLAKKMTPNKMTLRSMVVSVLSLRVWLQINSFIHVIAFVQAWEVFLLTSDFLEIGYVSMVIHIHYQGNQSLKTFENKAFDCMLKTHF